MAQKRPTGTEGAAMVALFINLLAVDRRISLSLMWRLIAKRDRAKPSLSIARPFAPKDIKAQIKAATRQKGRA